jgi:hypothetical protein
VLRSVTGKRTSASTMRMMGRNHTASMISMAAWAQCAHAWWSVASAPDHRDLRERPRPLPMVAR